MFKKAAAVAALLAVAAPVSAQSFISRDQFVLHIIENFTSLVTYDTASGAFTQDDLDFSDYVPYFISFGGETLIGTYDYAFGQYTDIISVSVY